MLKGEAYLLRREVKTRYVQAKVTVAKLAGGYQANAKGFEGGAGASAVELETRYGKEFSKGSARDESLTITGSLGVSTPAVICKTTDVDKDGVPELHVGLGGGPLTVEIKTEDPARTFNPVGAALKDGQKLIDDAQKQIIAAATKAFVR